MRTPAATVDHLIGEAIRNRASSKDRTQKDFITARGSDIKQNYPKSLNRQLLIARCDKMLHGCAAFGSIKRKGGLLTIRLLNV